MHNRENTEPVKMTETEGGEYPFLFSVVIPVYNVEQYLAETLDSVIGQTIGFENIQIILVNDGSPDNSEEICLRYRDKYPDNITYIKQENAGVSAARNNGIRYIKGKYVNFLDSDDCWEKNAFKWVNAFYEKYGDQVDVVGARKKFFDAASGYHHLDYKFFATRVIDLRANYEMIQMDVTGALMLSCNDALMNIGTRLNVPTMLKWQRQFGLGSRTGVDLPGEATGILFTEDNMSAIDLATCSFGQGYSSTMIQMVSAYCSILNGGYYYTPHIVRQLLDENGNVVKNVEPELVRTTISESTCEFLKQAAFETVERGGGYGARIPGHTVGGKTGTAQKYPIEEQNYVVSFMGFTPAASPKLLVYVVVDELEHEGTDVSSLPVVEFERDIMKRIIPYLGIPEDAENH